MAIENAASNGFGILFTFIFAKTIQYRCMLFFVAVVVLFLLLFFVVLFCFMLFCLRNMVKLVRECAFCSCARSLS